MILFQIFMPIGSGEYKEVELCRQTPIYCNNEINDEKWNLHKKQDLHKVESAQKVESAELLLPEITNSGICTESGICTNDEMTQCRRKTLNNQMFLILKHIL